MNMVVRWSPTKGVVDIDVLAETSQQVRELVALMAAIDLGEMFAAAPADRSARGRHEAGVSLLSLLERRLQDMLAQLQIAAER